LPGIQKFQFSDQNPYHRDTYGKEVTIPVFWDAIFLEKKKQLIQAWGARFGKNPHVVTVGMSCANATTDDWNIPASTPQEMERWKNLGYTPEKVLQTCKEILDATAAAFPGKVIAFAIGASRLDRPPSRVAEDFVDYAYTQYPSRVMAMRGNLSARTPSPTADALSRDTGRGMGGFGQRSPRMPPGMQRRFPDAEQGGAMRRKPFAGPGDPEEEGGGRTSRLWQLIFAHRPYTGAQMLWFVTGDETFRMNGKTAGEEKEIYRQAMQRGIEYGMSYLEVYHPDLLNPHFAEINEYTAAELGKQKQRQP
jgi:hypothetical protein